MTRAAMKVLAALRDAEQTETEIAIAAGVSLTDVRKGLDELAITGAVRSQMFEGLRYWRTTGEAA
jgi:transcription initiation factor IIE alpha subunit